MNKIIASALLLSVVIANPAIANPAAVKPAVAASKASPLYAGVNAGYTTLGVAFGGLVGYKIDPSLTPFMGKGGLAIEGNYTMLGSVAILTTTLSFSSMGIDAVAMYPIEQVKNLSAFGKLGFARVGFSCSGPFCSFMPNVSTMGLTYGGGGEYALSNNIAVRAGYLGSVSGSGMPYVSGIYNF